MRANTSIRIIDSNFSIFTTFTISVNKLVKTNELLYNDKKIDTPKSNISVIKNMQYIMRYILHIILSV